jgi:translation initiation factor 4A
MSSVNDDQSSFVNDEAHITNSQDEIKPEEPQSIQSFDYMELSDELLRGIYAYGFEKPSPIQQKSIVSVAKGVDVIGQAQSGTGKTGAFTIGMLQRICNVTKEDDKRICKAVIISPTRDLSEQILSVIEGISNYMDLKCVKCIGGTNWRDNVKDLKNGCDVVVGTPGRIYDMLQRKALPGYNVEIFILDEADEMLDVRGFQDKVYDILQLISSETQICLFSATMPKPVLELTQKFMRNPVSILVKNELLTLEGIRQFYIAVQQEDWKLDTICDLYKTISITSCVIFCNTRRKVEWVTREMRRRDYAVEATHGNLPPLERTEILKRFRKGDCRVLVTTDLLARGIDVQHVSIVINYDLPTNLENYLHRIGRSGRYGRKGLAINFVRNEDIQLLKDIERFYNTEIDELPNDIESLL